MRLGRYNFDGPVTNLNALTDGSGVYAVLALDWFGPGSHGVVDIGESQQVRSRLANHDRATQWRRFSKSGLGVAVLYCDANSRMAVERELRASLNPPCGQR